MEISKIKNITPIGEGKTVDLEIDSEDHNFFCEGVCISNSHAVSYGCLSAITTYLKFKYPQQFFLSLLKQSRNEPDPIDQLKAIQYELKSFNIKLLPPDLLKSEMDFTIEGDNLRFGLSSIKGISEKTIQKLIQFKVPHSNKLELFESAKNSGIGIGVLSALIQCGCLDSVSLSSSRALLTLEAQFWNILTPKEKSLVLERGSEYNFSVLQTYHSIRQEGLSKLEQDPKHKLLIKESRYQTVLKKYNPYKEVYDLNKKNMELSCVFYERLLLGFSYSHKLTDIFRPHYEDLMTVQEVIDASDGDKLSFVAFVSDKPIERTSKNKNKYGKFLLGDESGIIDCMIFNTDKNPQLDNVKNKHGGKLPGLESIVFCTGTKKGDAVFLNNLVDQGERIYTKYCQIQKKEEEKQINENLI